ncbi:hypothetical protein BJF90_31035 [Pseudonocardia sp. CNS-004]|nr:hypothetical protein BJF90_31035 [Pseudonocardia sp. CNS-004]
MAHPHDLGDVQRQVAHPLDVARHADRGHDGTQVPRDGAVEQQRLARDVLHLDAERVDRLVPRDDLDGKPLPRLEQRGGGAVESAGSGRAHLAEQLGQLGKLLRQRRRRHGKSL